MSIKIGVNGYGISCSLSVSVSLSLSWTNHVTALCKTISKKVYPISYQKIKHFLNRHARKLFSHAHIFNPP